MNRDYNPNEIVKLYRQEGSDEIAKIVLTYRNGQIAIATHGVEGGPVLITANDARGIALALNDLADGLDRVLGPRDAAN